MAPMQTFGTGWYYNPISGAITDVTNNHGLPVVGAVTQLKGPFATRALAEAYKADHPPSSLTPAAQDVAGAVTSVPDFLSRLTSPELWLRVVEVGIGVGLIFIVIKNTSAGQAVASKAKSAAGMAAFL